MLRTLNQPLPEGEEKVALGTATPSLTVGLLPRRFTAGADGFGGLGCLICYFGAGVLSGGVLDEWQVFFGANISEGAQGINDGRLVGEEARDCLIDRKLVALLRQRRIGNPSIDGRTEFIEII